VRTAVKWCWGCAEVKLSLKLAVKSFQSLTDLVQTGEFLRINDEERFIIMPGIGKEVLELQALAIREKKVYILDGLQVANDESTLLCSIETIHWSETLTVLR
jgi:hypothetical protein